MPCTLIARRIREGQDLMKKTFLFTFALAACSMQGALISYTDAASVTGVIGNIIARADGLFTAKATGWTLGTSNGASFAAANVRDYGTPGLGVCNAAELSNGVCSSSSSPSEHQVDNVSGYDFVMFQFTNTNTDVKNLATNIKFTIGSLASDYDVTYWLGNTTGNVNTAWLQGRTVANLINSGFTETNLNNPASTTINVGNVTGFNTIIFGTRGPGSNPDIYADGFKIKSLEWTVQNGGTGVVENVPAPTQCSEQACLHWDTGVAKLPRHSKHSTTREPGLRPGSFCFRDFLRCA